MVPVLKHQMGIVTRAHYFVQLFARTHANDLFRQPRCHCFSKVNNADGGYLGHEDFPAPHALKIGQYEVDALLQ
jgi:hypothetical protein